MHSNKKTARPAALAKALRLALFSLPLVIAHSPTALASADAGTRATTLDKVEVTGARPVYQLPESSTATKTETPLIDVPQSVSVITADLIEDQAMQNMADVVRYIPGVQMAQGEGHRDAPILRGNTSTSDFFVDSVRDDVQYLRDLYNVERIEVLKGPAGMIFGRGGAGGLINRVTKQADGSDTAALNLTLGSWDQFRATGDYSHALSDNAAFRVAAMVEDTGSYRDHYQLERWAINPTLTFRGSDRTWFNFGYEHFEDDRTVDRGVPSLNGRPLQVDESTFFGKPEDSYAYARVDALTSKIEHEFEGGARLVNHTRYADYDKFYQNVLPGSVIEDFGRVIITGYSNLTERQNLINQTDLTFNAKTGSIEHEVLVGAELSRQVTDNFRQTGYFPDYGVGQTSHYVMLPNTIYTRPVEFRQSASDADNHSVATAAAVYVQDQLTFSPQWQAIVGLRFDRFEADLRNNRTGATLDSSDDLFSPRAGLIYKPQDNVSLYASYTMAYVPRAGEQLASLTASNRALDPEEFENREIGLKWDIGNDFAFTAAVFQLDQKNVAVNDPDNPGQSILVDGQRVEGVELSLSGQIRAGWQILAGYAYQDSVARNGNTLAQVPEHSVSLWNRYAFNDAFAMAVGVVHNDRVFAAADNAVTLPGYTRVDAALYYTINDRIRLQANIENLFDEEYYASAHNNNNIMPGAPLGLRVGLNMRF